MISYYHKFSLEMYLMALENNFIAFLMTIYRIAPQKFHRNYLNAIEIN